jgi:hypothetical protein
MFQECAPLRIGEWASILVAMRAISMGAAFHFAWPVLKKHFWLFAAVLLTFLASWVVLEAIVIGGQRFGILLWTIAHIAFLVFFSGLELGFLQICLDYCDGRNPTYSDVFRRLGLGPKFLAGQLVYLLMVGMGLVLLVAPGVYAGVRYGLIGFCMVEGEPKLMRCFQQSAMLTEGSGARLCGMLVILFFLNLLGASLLGIGLLITVPLSGLMASAVFRQLTGPREETEAAVS